MSLGEPFPPIVTVEWLDSGLQLDKGWATRDTYIASAHLAVVYTTGYLMHEDDDIIVVSPTYDPKAGHFFAAQVIDKASVRARTLEPEASAAA